MFKVNAKRNITKDCVISVILVILCLHFWRINTETCFCTKWCCYAV